MRVRRPYIGLVLTICFPAHGRSDHKLRPDVPGGYLARHAPSGPAISARPDQIRAVLLMEVRALIANTSAS
jgi:hypothetical protein